MHQTRKISVVTPTLKRSQEVADLLENLSQQKLLPLEVILVDGAPEEEKDTENIFFALRDSLPFGCYYKRQGGGTAIQRNVGIEMAKGEFIAFIDDDVRLEPNFFQVLIAIFDQDKTKKIGGISGYPVNDHFTPEEHIRWRWYRRLRLFSTYEPGAYDFVSGVPINVNLQPPFSGVRRVNLMSTSDALWRRDVFLAGLKFDRFFRDFGVAEDFCFSLEAGRNWQLFQCGDACCQHLKSPRGRVNDRKTGVKSVVNYYYLFQKIAGPLSLRRKMYFFRFQMFEFIRIVHSCLVRHRRKDFQNLLGRIEGLCAVVRGIPFEKR